MKTRALLLTILAGLGFVLGPHIETLVFGPPNLVADIGEQYERAAVGPRGHQVIGLRRTSAGWSVGVSDLKGVSLLGPIEVADPPARAQTLDWDPSGRWAVYGGASEVQVFDLQKKTVITLDAVPLVRQVAIRGHILMARCDGTVILWDLRSGQRVCEFRTAYLVQADLSADGRTLALGCFEGGIRLVDVRSGRVVRRLSDGWTPAGLKFCHQDKWLATALRASDHERDRARLFDVSSGRQLGPDISAPDLRGMSVNANGDRLLLRTSEHAVIVEPATGREIGRNPITSLFIDSLSPKGDLAATHAENSRGVTVWETATGKTVATLSHPSPLSDLRFVDNERIEVVGGRYRLWKVR